MKKLLLTVTIAAAALSAHADWNVDNGGVTIWPDEVSYPDFQLKVSSKGNSWLFLNQIGYASNLEASELSYIQELDPNGNPLFGEYPYLLSDEYYQTYVLIEDNLLIDRDGNAIAAVMDRRYNEYVSISVYKIAPDGTQLWGENGIIVDGNVTSDAIASFNGTQLDDGSYVFAWMSMNNRTDNCEIVVQRVLSDGTMAWEPQSVKLSAKGVEYQYPHIQDAGSNQYLLAYAEGSGGALKVMKYDFDGTPVWNAAAEVYNGSWGSTPMWLKVNYAPSGDGGMLIAWYADPAFTNFEDAYLQYVKPDGQLGFNVRNGLQIDYETYRHIGVNAVYDPDSDSFIAAMMACDGNQNYYTLKAQRISRSGELMWGEEALTIKPLSTDIIGAPAVLLGDEGEATIFYQYATDYMGTVVYNVAHCLETYEGDTVWTAGFGIPESPKGNLQVARADDFWVAAWTGNDPEAEAYSASIANVYAMRVNFDGTSGNTSGISAIARDADTSICTIDGRNVTFAESSVVYDLQGRTVAAGLQATLRPGLYLVKTAGGTSERILIK